MRRAGIFVMRQARTGAALFLCAFLTVAPAIAGQIADPAAHLDSLIAAAEGALRDGELQAAESRYRSALEEGWILAGALAAADRQLPAAIDAFRTAATSVADAVSPLRLLAIVYLQHGEAEDAVRVLSDLSMRRPADAAGRRLLSQALVAAGRLPEAIQQLEEARAQAPDDLELAFALASGYVRVNKVGDADRLFREIASARPLPQTDMLIGRTYRDAGEYGRAGEWFEAALAKDPRVRHAHYYLGTLAVRPDGVLELERAIDEFRRELALAPDDPLANLRLGMALVELHRDADASGPLQLAAASPSAPAVAFYYLGRHLLGVGRPADAAAAFRRALELASRTNATGAQIGSIHYQLGTALRDAGALEDAAQHFAEAEQRATARPDAERERLARYLLDTPDPASAADSIAGAVALPEDLQFDTRPPADRQEMRRRIMAVLARAYLNIGIMHAQGGRFDRAAEFCEQAANIDAAFPQVQYSLGVAYFNARRYGKAAASLARALAADPGNRTVSRMLAIASLETEDYARAASLLADDPDRERDASLQYTYGLALVRGDRAAEAEAIFTRLLSDHATTPELSVVLGHAYAQQGNYDAAIDALRRALQLKPAVADANNALGLIYLKQGKLAESESALRAEVDAHPANINARERLATVLELLGRVEQAAVELRTVLAAKPDVANARYLLGKILLARGDAEQAIGHLEVAAQLAPDEANVRYQLARAYEKAGRPDEAEKAFAVYQSLKEKQRGKTP
jgi:tetratricopeptide (TPR) repeat protein